MGGASPSSRRPPSRSAWPTPRAAAKGPPACPVRMVVFTVNLIVGLLFAQALPEWLSTDAYLSWMHVVKICTMLCLSYIMVHVGYEFDIDKSRLRSYAKDYAVGMTAAGLPWIGVAAWFIWVLPNPLGWKEALVAARFAADAPKDQPSRPHPAASVEGVSMTDFVLPRHSEESFIAFLRWMVTSGRSRSFHTIFRAAAGALEHLGLTNWTKTVRWP